MNKKLATLLFAIGLGVASSPTLASTCVYYCNVQYNACMSDGVTPAADCDTQRVDCFAAC